MMTNAGRYDKRIRIVKDVQTTDKDGFPTSTRETILEPYARVKTTSGYTLIQNDSDFEKALTNFTIRYPGTVAIDRDMLIEYNDKTYTIQYLNNVNEAGIELEIQAKVVMH
jgi:SPP1 family predicted phage head-tail adaptor